MKALNTYPICASERPRSAFSEGAAVEMGDFRGVDLASQPELSAFAAPFGMHAEHVVDPSELDAALARARASVEGGTTAIVNVVVSK